MYLCIFCTQIATDVVDVKGQLPMFTMCPSCSNKLAIMVGHLGTTPWRILGIEDLPTLLPPAIVNAQEWMPVAPDGESLAEPMPPIQESDKESILDEVEKFLKGL